MVRHRGEAGLVLADVLNQVSIVDSQASAGMKGQSEISLVFMAHARGLTRRRIVIDSLAGNEKGGEVQLFQPARARLNTPKRLREGGYPRQRGIVERAQPDIVVAEGMHIDVGAARHIRAEAGVEKII